MCRRVCYTFTRLLRLGRLCNRKTERCVGDQQIQVLVLRRQTLAEIPVTDKMFTLQKLLDGVSDTGLALVDKKLLTKYEYNQFIRGIRKLVTSELVAEVDKRGVYLLNPKHITDTVTQEKLSVYWEELKS